VRPMTQGRN